MPATINEPVLNLDHLRKRASMRWCEIAVKLNGGARSSKDVFFDDLENRWHVFHYIDSTDAELSEAEMGESFIAAAISKGACMYV